MKPLLIAGLALILAIANWAIFSREQLKAHGTVAYLELLSGFYPSAQGDYMSLWYKIDRTTPKVTEDGFLIVKLDDRRIATAVGWNTEPATGELRLKYRTRHGRTSIGTDSYFFQQGTADRYETARYGEFRIDSNGNALLTRLRDANLQRLGPI